jgi:hypothetical protein
MSINCAICHTVRARIAVDAEPQLYFGGAGNTIDIQGYQRFLSSCANDEAFTAENLIPAMGAKVRLGFAEKQLYRFILIPVVRKQLRKQGTAYAWTGQRPLWGQGFCYDTRLIGNSNGGHLYGTALPAAEKGDLLAYLLTL